MNSLRLFDNRIRVSYVAAAFALLLTTFLPALVSADQVTDRSIALSSSSVSATNVTYTVNFKAVKAAGAFVIDFCSDSPVLNQTCTAPTDFNASAAATSTPGFTMGTLTTSANNKLTVTGTMAAGATVAVDITGINNPSVAGPLYARIVTYTNATDAATYTSTNVDNTGANTHVDDGSVAMSITPTVAVSGAVLETMTFCVAKVTITENCGDASTAGHEPVLKLGEPSGDTVALDAGHLSTGSLYTQISTNALNGAVVNLKSGVDCGGLKRVGATTCDIAPALTGGFSSGTAKFGVMVAAASTDTGATPSGTFQAHGAYNDSTYTLNYVAGGASGVTSTYGDPFLDTNNAPVNNKNMQLTFGASVSNSTPAGNYSADLSMIATGKF